MASPLRIAVMGAQGRMGREIQAIIESTENLLLAAAVDRNNTSGPRSIDQLNPQNVDIVIDFTLPEAFDQTLNWCVDNSVALVSGTTGLSKSQLDRLKDVSQKVAILWAPNMSLGVAIVNEILKTFKSLPDFDYQVEEFHHNKKKDKPSGTALLLQKTLEETLGRELPEALSGRGGGIFGIHKVWAMSDEEVITVEHTALNRSVFARGAVQAAQWLVSQPPGQYSIGNVLGLG